MFYAQFVLAKKGALGQLWLAAHWERKMNREQVLAPNLEEAVDEMKQPRSKMSLRTTGHLLLGLCRIFSSKANYLHMDCESAYNTLKVSFQPGTVEFQMLKNSAKGKSSNDTDLLDDLDAIMPDISEFDFAPAPMQQSRIDDITLQEDNFDTRSVRENDLLNDDFDECASNFDEEFERTRQNFERLKQTDESLEMARRSVSYLSDGDVNSDSQSVHKDAIEEDDDALDANGGDFEDYELNSAMELENRRPDEELVLEPLSETQLSADKEKHRQKRRRKLVWDDMTTIGGDEMKHNLNDYADTLQALELAPPTKRLMRIKQFGQLERIYTFPATDIYLNPTFNRVYHQHLVARARTLDSHSADDVRLSLGMLDTIDDDYENEDPNQEFDDFSQPYFGENSLNGNDNSNDQYENGSLNEDLESTDKKLDDDEEDDEEPDVDNDETVFSKRTLGVLHTISQKFKTNENHILLDDLLTNKSTTKTRAQKFYALLELHKAHAIQVDQNEPFGPISIKPGSQIEEFTRLN